MNIPIGAVIDLLHLAADGTLATHSTTMPGYPYGTAVSHVPDESHRPVLCISRLAEHTKNIIADSRVSYAVTPPGTSDIQNAPRMTLVADAEPFEPHPAFIERLLRYQPSAEPLLGLDFSFFRLSPRRVRYIGGLGKMGWIDGSAWSTISSLSSSDEQTILRERCASQTRGTRLLGVDRYGLDLELKGRRQRHRFPNAPLETDDIGLTVQRMLSALP